MATATVTVTAKTGPAAAVSGLAITEVKALVLDFSRQVVQVFKGSLGTAPYKEFDMADTITITDTVAGAGLGHTIVISSS